MTRVHVKGKATTSTGKAQSCCKETDRLTVFHLDEVNNFQHQYFLHVLNSAKVTGIVELHNPSRSLERVWRIPVEELRIP
jgi:hypothetical protein